MKLILPIAFSIVLVALGHFEVDAAQARSDLSPDRLREIPKRMKAFVDDREISGSVTLVARHGQIASLEAVGLSDIENQRKMRIDDLFWIASMTKPITATAILMLQDEGKLSVDDPVEKHLPEFEGQWMIETQSSERITMTEAPRSITLRDLLTHTSGLGNVVSPRPNSSLAELVMAYSQKPLLFPPGSKWQYSNAGMNTLGRIVEVVSGKPFAQFLDQRIFQPLGMKNTMFYPDKNAQKRIAKPYEPASNENGLKEISIYFFQGDLESQDRTPYPAGGLFSTAEDLFRFYQMALNGGEYEGKRILSKSAVDMMTHTQTGDMWTGFVDGMSFGLGFAVVKEPQGVTAMLSPGTFGHGGAYATQSWADPRKDLIVILMIQRAKLPNGDGSPMRKAFQEAAVAAILQ